MGNQLVGAAPAQIFPVEYYLSDIPELTFDSSLGSTRFLKVAKASSSHGSGGPVVVKVFSVLDPSVNLNNDKDKIAEILRALESYSSPNCLPYERALLTDKAGFLVRQHIKDSVYDRISTRPFLTSIEKKWIAFQLLLAVHQAHKRGVCHGDIKLENVMITSWNLVLLTDFASFKPTYLPEDNPADYNYFFDTSRRRTCYLAPERFKTRSFVGGQEAAVMATTAEFLLSEAEEGMMASSAAAAEAALSESKAGMASSLYLPDAATSVESESEAEGRGELQPSMDIFSVGCALIELFTEGAVPFTFSQLLAYKAKDYEPSKALDKIEDEQLRTLLVHMIQRDPAQRHSAARYLSENKGLCFPAYFYDFLHAYSQAFSTVQLKSPDRKINRIHDNLDDILAMARDEDNDFDDQGLVLLSSLVTSNMRSLTSSNSKLRALEILKLFSEFLPSEVILDRILPFIITQLSSKIPVVRASAVYILLDCIKSVKQVPTSDASMFPEYILPCLMPLCHDKQREVRAAFASVVASIALESVRFLQMLEVSFKEEPEQLSFHAELMALLDMIGHAVSTLLADSSNFVKQALVEKSVNSLAVFFGKTKANDVILSHMITFLNDKEDWHLRDSFYINIVGVACFVGSSCSPILLPLLQQGLSDPEEFVVTSCINAMACLTSQDLLQKVANKQVLHDTAPFMIHPNIWVRQAAVGLFAEEAQKLCDSVEDGFIDVVVKLVPYMAPFLTRKLIQVNNPALILSTLTPCIPRQVYENVVKVSSAETLKDLFRFLEERRAAKSSSPTPEGPPDSGGRSFEPPPPPNIAQLYRKLEHEEMTPEVEEKLLRLRDHLIKTARHRAASSVHKGGQQQQQQRGMILTDTSSSRKAATIKSRSVDLRRSVRKGGRPAAAGSMTLPDQSSSAADGPLDLFGPPRSDSSSTVNEEWRQMFGMHVPPIVENPVVPENPAATEAAERLAAQLSPQYHPVRSSGSEDWSGTAAGGGCGTGSSSSREPSQQHLAVSPPSRPQFGGPPTDDGRRSVSPFMEALKPVESYKIHCKAELASLIDQKRREYRADVRREASFLASTSDKNFPGRSWRPQGILVAHLQEHMKGVTKLVRVPNTTVFASSSEDGLIKLWDCAQFERSQFANKAVKTFGHHASTGVTSIAASQSGQLMASGGEDGSIHVFKIDEKSDRSVRFSAKVDTEAVGPATHFNFCDLGCSGPLLVYGTPLGKVCGWDLRQPAGTHAFVLSNDLKDGVQTAMAVSPDQCWAVTGTSSGVLTCWDLRFQLPVIQCFHPASARVRDIVVPNVEEGGILVAVQGNNEVGLWNLESRFRQMVLWASSSPLLSAGQSSSQTVTALQSVRTNSDTNVVLTAGTDMRVRLWDLQRPERSYIVCGSANEVINPSLVSYKVKLVDGTEVVQEVHAKPKNVLLPNSGQPASSSAAANASAAASGSACPSSSSSSSSTASSSAGNKLSTDPTSPSNTGFDRPSLGHRNWISSLALCPGSVWYAVTGSKDGIVKVWK